MAKRSAIWLQDQWQVVGIRLLRVGLLLLTGSMLIPIGGGVVSESVAQQDSLREDPQDRLSDEEMALILASEKQRIAAIDRVIGSVVAIYGENRQGGGSGVIVDPSGIALTNHHVIIGAGVSGWGGLADGKLYHWKLVGTDPGGDLAIIQLEGQASFPFAPLGDSDKVRVGDWVLAMGNPFVLTEDQRPTVTLGIVSGVKRYQPGAGKNQLIYGNCIQVDSSINPGNSGGPLFNLQGDVIGINGRGSFQDRGRVNVGLGYAISANQIRNFIPELLATKLVEHGTLDANFTDRNGKVVCKNLYENTPLYLAGMRPGDELLEFEGVPIKTANQFTNLICTLPENWPARLKFRDASGELQTFHSRLFGLPYVKPKRRSVGPGNKKPSPEEKQQQARQQAMFKLLAATPGTIRNPAVNKKQASRLIARWNRAEKNEDDMSDVLYLVDDIIDSKGEVAGKQEFWFSADFRQFRAQETLSDQKRIVVYDGKKFVQLTADGVEELAMQDAKQDPLAVSAIGILTANGSPGQGPLLDHVSVRLDGAGLAQWRNAYRFQVDMEQAGNFYFWLGETGNVDLPSFELLKASASLDCDGQTGGITFSNWHSELGARIPSERMWIRNLTESKVLEFQNRTVVRVDDASPSFFQVLVGSDDR